MKTAAYRLANATALVGGLVLVAIIVMTVVSVTGRALIFAGLGPVPGDYELTELGMAIVIFCFLPLCQLEAGHATVDVFTARLGAAANRVLLALWEVVLTAAIIFIVWRLFEGFRGKSTNGETSMLLQVPVWWAYAAALVPAGVCVLVGLWSAGDRIAAAVTGRDTRAAGGTSH